jgi:putative peptidoglycan lipid II flippase
MGMRFAPSFDYRHPDVVKVWKLMLPVVLGVALPQVSIWINRAFASKLGDGPMAALTNANQLMQVPLGLFAQAMAVAIFPTLSALAAEKKYAELRSTSSRGIRNLLFLTIPSSVFMVILAVPIVQLLLQHGKFHYDDTLLAASALMVYGTGIFAWSMQSILSRSFYALQDSVTPVVIGTLVTVVFVPLNLLFMNTFHMGIEGLALATTIAATLHVIVMMWVLRNRLRGFEMGPLLLSVGKTTLASAIAGLVCWLSKSAVDHLFHSPNGHVKIHAALSLATGFGFGGAVYIGCASALKMDEMRQALAMLRRKTRKAV